MVFEKDGLKVLLFSELSGKEKSLMRTFFESRSPNTPKAEIRTFFEKVLADKSNLMFCAFLGSKPLGFSTHNKKYGRLNEYFPMQAHTPKSFLLKSKKTVGRLLYEADIEYGKQHNLRIPRMRGRSLSGLRAEKRIPWKTHDIPKPVKRKR